MTGARKSKKYVTRVNLRRRSGYARNLDVDHLGTGEAQFQSQFRQLARTRVLRAY
jgi:hypothetical protein